MTTLREAAQQALEALDRIAKYENPQTKIQVRKKDGGPIVTIYPHKVALDAAQALRTALSEPEPRNQCGETCERAKLCATCARGIAEPEQEPMAYVSGSYAGHFTVVPTNPALVLTTGMALYTHPPQRKPLKDEEIDAVTVEQWGEMKGYPLAAHRAFARAIERAHGIGGEA